MSDTLCVSHAAMPPCVSPHCPCMYPAAAVARWSLFSIRTRKTWVQFDELPANTNEVARRRLLVRKLPQAICYSTACAVQRDIANNMNTDCHPTHTRARSYQVSCHTRWALMTWAAMACAQNLPCSCTCRFGHASVQYPHLLDKAP